VTVAGADLIGRLHSSSVLRVVMIVTLLVYAMGLRGDFMFDDHPNITENFNVQIQSLDWSQLKQAWNSGIVGVGGRALAMLSFGINNAITGLNPVGFKIVNLGLHLLNGLIVFWLARALVRSADRDSTDALPLWVAAAWLLHPVNLTPVLLIVQRMTELAALFTFAGTLLYIHLRRSPPRSRLLAWPAWLCVPLLWALGFLGKETAVLAPLFVMATEFFVLHRSGQVKSLPTHWVRAIAGLVLLGLLAIVAIAYYRGGALALDSYHDRDFTLAERLLTETRIVWFYVKLVALPVLSDFNLFHDGLVISRGLLEPWTTMAATVGWSAVLVLLIVAGRKVPLVGLGVAWFLVGHGLESTFIPLELIFEHRNYVPSFGLILAAAESFRLLSRRLVQRGRQPIVWLLACLPLLALAGLTGVRAHAYGSPLRMYMFEVEHNPGSYRAHQYLALNLHEENLDRLESDQEMRKKIRMHLARATELNPEVTQPYLMQIYMACRYGDPVDPTWAAVLLQHWQGPRPFGERMHTMFKFANAAIRQELCMDKDVPVVHFKAFIGNPRVPPRYRAAILLRYAMYMHLVKEDRSAALALARQALAESDEPAVKREVADILHTLGEIDEANRILQSIPREQRVL